MTQLGSRWSLADGPRIIIGRAMAAAVMLIGTASAATYVALGDAHQLYRDWIAHNVVMGGFGLGILVWLAVAKQPRNGVVWALAWSSVFQVLNAASQAWTRAAADAAGIVRPLGELTGSEVPLSVAIPFQLSGWTWVPGVFLMVTLAPLLFPAGELPSPRWRIVAWGAVGSMAAIAAGFFWMTRPMADSQLTLDERVFPSQLEPVFLLLGVAVLASVGSLVLRYRRSEGEERNQFRWVAWGAGVFALGALTLLMADVDYWEDIVGSGSVFRLVSLATGAVFVTSLIVAVTKYRLYDIDVVINRTVMAVALVSLIAALYVGVVVGVGSLVGSDDETSFDMQIIATVVVAIAFHPARRRAQGWANRLVYGQRSTPYEVLATFSHRAAEATDDELLARIPPLIVDGTGATEATIWVKAGDLFHPAASWPRGLQRISLPAAISQAGFPRYVMRELNVEDSPETFFDPESDHSSAVFHGGELLGGVSLVTARGEALPPPEVELVEHLAAGLGLAIRNARLTAQLREQVAELEASRERILAAADEARRDLERDLDSGPQQQLVALKVKLGPTRMRAEQLGATKTAAIVEQLETEAGDAIRAVRDFSSGIYPPLLEAEGVVPAISQRIQRATFPIHVDGNGIGRYPRDIEAAIYFSILEALQNVAKYANASAASVAVRDGEGELRFEVTDDGDGFEPSQVTAGSGLVNMGDRLDAVGGSLRVESAPGEGTTVSGVIPVAAAAPS